MSKKALFSLKMEQHIIAGLMKFPHSYFTVNQFVRAEDFADPSRVNSTIYHLIGSAVEKSEAVDPVVIAQKASALGITFEDGISIFDYLQSLGVRAVSEQGCIDAAKIVKKYAVRRKLIDVYGKLSKDLENLDDEVSFDEIISMADGVYSNELNIYFNSQTQPHNVFSDMERNVEERGENPITDLGIMTHFPRTNEMFGSLLKEGNITIIASRYGVGKSTLAFDICSKAGIANNVPVLSFDNGEQSLEEIQMRMCASISGVPLYHIESGMWRSNPVYVERVRATWKKIKEWKERCAFYYYNVGGMDYDEMINMARRWYYSNVGRGNRMIWSLDYLKLGSLGSSSDNFWADMGLKMDKMKTFIAKEIVYENKPKISLFSSVQANRSGAVTNRTSAEINDSETIVGLSDMIGQIASHVFILRKKITEEIIADGEHFGTHKLIPIKHRHMGVNPARAFDLVSMPDGSKKPNFINLHFDNFSTRECGDLRDWVDHLHIDNARPRQDGANGLPL